MITTIRTLDAIEPSRTICQTCMLDFSIRHAVENFLSILRYEIDIFDTINKSFWVTPLNFLRLFVKVLLPFLICRVCFLAGGVGHNVDMHATVVVPIDGGLGQIKYDHFKGI